MKTRHGIAVAVLLLAGCSGDAGRSGSVTADQDRQLNEAADMLDANGVSIDAVADQGEGNSQ